MTPSHRLKLYRADKHLGDFEEIVQPARERSEHPVIESMQPKRKAPEWEYRLDLSGVQLDPAAAILIGDYMFNVRSALDHLVVAIAPRKYRRRVSFPICIKDPFARDAGGDYLDAEAAGRWESMTQGLPNDCIANLKAMQPYESAALHRHRPEYHALALLSAFQNADKHRELVDAIVGLIQVERHLNGDITCFVPIFKDGTVVAASPEKMNVKVEGAPVVGIKWGDDIVGLDTLTNKLVSFIADEALPRLEPFLE